MAGIGVRLEWNDEMEKDIFIQTPVLNAKFEELDTDKDGKLTFDEVRQHIVAQVLRRMRQNPTDSEIKNLKMESTRTHIYHINLDIENSGDGAVSKKELRDWIKQLFAILQDPKKSLQYAIDVMFRACDADKNGKISKTEISNFMREEGSPLKDSEIDQVFAVVDSDGDPNTLTKEGFTRVLLIGKAMKESQHQYSDGSRWFHQSFEMVQCMFLSYYK